MQDIRFAIRHPRRHAGFTLAAALTPGIGLAATQFATARAQRATAPAARHKALAGDFAQASAA